MKHYFNQVAEKFKEPGPWRCTLIFSPLAIPLASLALAVALNPDNRIQKTPSEHQTKLALPDIPNIQCIGHTALRAITQEGQEVLIPLPSSIAC